MKKLLALIILFLIIPLAFAQNTVSSGVETAQIIKEIKEGNAKLLQEISGVSDAVTDSVNGNNDANMAFIDALFKRYLADTRKATVVGILGSAFILAAVLGLIQLRMHRKQYFLTTFKQQVEEQKELIKKQTEEIKQLKEKLSQMPVQPMYQPPQQPYQPQYQQYPQYPQYQQYGGNQR